MCGCGCPRSFRGNLRVVYPLQHDSTLKFFSEECFSKNEMKKRNPKKIQGERVGKGQVVQPNETGWDMLEYVGQVGQGQGGLHIGWDRMGLGQGGLQIRWDRLGLWTGLCPDEPVNLSQSGTISFFLSFLGFEDPT